MNLSERGRGVVLTFCSVSVLGMNISVLSGCKTLCLTLCLPDWAIKVLWAVTLCSSFCCWAALLWSSSLPAWTLAVSATPLVANSSFV